MLPADHLIADPQHLGGTPEDVGYVHIQPGARGTR